METAQLQTHSPEGESRARDNVVAPSVSRNGLGLHALDQFSSGAAGETREGDPIRLLSKASLSHSANRPMLVLALQRAQQSQGNLFAQRALTGGLIQRHCSCGGTCEHCRAQDELPVADSNPIEGGVPVLQRQPADVSELATVNSHEENPIPSGSGEPMGAEARGFMEARFHTDFSDVRIHTDARAVQSAEMFQSDAYTSGRDIYFAAGQYAPTTRRGQRLLAHELTHTIQQGNRSAAPMVPAQAHQKVLISQPNDPLEHEAERAADLVMTSESGAVVHPVQAPATAQGTSQSTFPASSVTASHGNQSVRIARQTAPVSAQPEPEKEGWLEGEIWGLLEEYAPNLVPIIRRGPEGVFDWIKDKVTGAIGSFVETMMAPVRAVGSTGKWLQDHFGPLLTWMQDAATKIAQNDCRPIAEAAQKIEDLAAELITPVIEKLKQIADKVGGFLKNIWDRFGAPVWEFIKNYAGQQWDQLQKLGEWIWDKTAKVRQRISSAWTWLKNKIGIGEGPEGQNGVLQWIQAKAGAAWDTVQAKLEPYKKQIATVATVVAGIAILISPAGPVLLAGAAIVGVVQGVKWIRANLGNGDAIVRARTYAQTVLIPQLLGAIGKMTGAVTQMVSSISEKLGAFSAELGKVLGAATGTALHFLVEAAQWLADKATELATWATGKLTALADWIKKGLERLRTFLQPVMDFLTKAGNLLADIYGLPMLLAEGLWNKIPKCIRDPFVDWIIPLILRQIDIFKELVKDNEAWQKTKAEVMNIVRLVFVTKDLLGAVRATFHLILRVFNVPIELLMTVIQKAQAAWDTVVAAPIKFIKNCVRTVGMGLQLYWNHLKDNLLFGLEGWLFGELAEKGISKPQSWTDPWDVAQFVLSVMGLSINHLFELMQKRFDKTTVDKLRVWYGRLSRVWDWVTEIRSKKPAEVTAEIIASAKGFAKSIFEGIVIWIVEKVSTELATMAAAAAASAGLSEVLDAIRRVYRAIKTAVRWMRTILEMVNNALDSIMNIAAGTLAPAAALLEGAMKRATPAVIGFLGDQVGLGGIADKIRELIDDLREKIDETILTIFDKLKEFFTMVGGRVEEPKEGKAEETASIKEPFSIGPEGHTITASLAGSALRVTMASDADIVLEFQLKQAISEVQNDKGREETQKDAIINRHLAPALAQVQNIRQEYDGSIPFEKFIRPRLASIVGNLADLSKYKPPITSLQHVIAQGRPRFIPEGYDIRKKLYDRATRGQWDVVSAAFKAPRIAEIRRKCFSIWQLRDDKSDSRNYTRAEEQWKALQTSTPQEIPVEKAPTFASYDHLRHFNLFEYETDHKKSLGEFWNGGEKNADDDTRAKSTLDRDNFQMLTGEENRKKSGVGFERDVGPKFSSEVGSSPEGSATIDGIPFSDKPTGIQRKSTNTAGGPALTKPRDKSVIPPSGSGEPIDEQTRTFMESGFQCDFRDVQIHTDTAAAASAEALEAEAYTSGRDIYFARGRYAPQSDEGKRLLAHELTHTIQQSEGKVPSTVAARTGNGLVVGAVNDPMEAEAERAAHDIIQEPRLAHKAQENNGTSTSFVRQHPIQRRQTAIVQRDGGSSAPKGLTAAEYVERNAAMIAFAVSTRMARIELPTGSPFASWWGGHARPFMGTMWEDLSQVKLLETLRSLLQPIPPENIVDRGRDLSIEVTDQGQQFQTGRGKDAYSTDVATELTNALTSQLNQSLRRIMPRYVTQRYKLKVGLPPTADKSVVPQPSPSDILPAHPMDRLVIATLCRGGMVEVDFEGFSKQTPAIDEPNKASKPRAVTFELQGARGAWYWLLVKNPPDASVEEVSSSLYGDPAQAFRMINAAPLFGFTGADLLLPVHKQKLKEMSADPKTAESKLYPLAKQQAGLGVEPANLDPLAELAKGPLADDAALNQASRLKPPEASNKPKVLEDMRLSFEILDSMIPNARRFHDDGRLAEARDYLQAKRNALAKANDLDVVRWAAQAAEQQRILSGASAGLGTAVAQLDALLKADKRIMHGHELADYVKMPLLELATAYINVAGQSFFVKSGDAALQAAEDRSRLYNVELMEGILRAAAHSIEVAAKDKTGEKVGGNEFEFGISKLREREEALRTRLSKAHQSILNNPDAIGTLLEEIYKDVADLQTEVAIVANLDAIDSLQKALYDSQDWWGDIVNQEYELRRNHLAEVAYWRRAWEEVYDSWKKGDHEKARDYFRELVTKPEFTSVFEHTADYVKDAATWSIVARIVGLIAITIVTWGMGTWATGFSAARWGGALAATGELAAGAARAGMIGGAVAEAVTFTTLNALLLEPEVTLKGLLVDFGANLFLFGILRKFTMMYRAAAAVKAAAAAGKTTLVAAGEMGIAWATTTIANIARAEIEERLKHQKNLTKEEIGKILLKSTAMFIGMVVAARVAEPIMKELAASGTTMGVRLRLINAQRERMAVVAENTRANGNVGQARTLITQDRAELQAEIDFYEQLLRNPDVLAKAGYKPEQIKLLRDTGTAQVLEINVAEAMIEAEPLGDNVYQMPQEKLPAALEAHRKAGAETTLLRRDETAKSETWLIKPKNGSELRITTKAPDQTKIRLDSLRDRLSPEGKEAFDRFVAHAITPNQALQQLEQMAKSQRGLEASVIEAAKRLPVLETIPGLYASVKIDPRQGPWTFETKREETTLPDGGRQILLTTNVTLKAPDGTIHSAGPVMRTITLRPNTAGGYDVDLTMDMAFLDAIPENLRWVNEGGVPLRQGQGVPLQTYITLMQMRMEGVGLGQLTTAHLSTLVNARGACELASLRQKYAPGIPANRIPSNLIERTQSGKYGMTNVIQAGAKVRGMSIEGGYERTVAEAVRGSEMDNDQELAKLGLSRNQKILWGFDILIDIEPPAAPSSGTKAKP